MTLQQHSYAPLPGYIDPVPKIARLPDSVPAASQPLPAVLAAPGAPTEHYAYDEGRMSAPEMYSAMQAYENFYEKKEMNPNNTMILAMSVTTGGLLLILLLLVIFTKPSR